MFLNTLVQKAQSFIDPALTPITSSRDKQPSKATLFRYQFRLPDAENPIHEITAELVIPLPYKSSTEAGELKSNGQTRGNIYAGKLHLSESFLCFTTLNTSFHASSTFQASTAFTGQTHGTGPAGNGFTLPLSAVRKVERLPTQNSLCALAITTWNGMASAKSPTSHYDMQRFTLQLAGSRQACDNFCDGLKKGLRNGVKQLDNLRSIASQCYSEYLLSAGKDAQGGAIAREPPEAGLGMLFRYPGDPRKLRDRSKMRLWGEYFRDNGRNAMLLRQPTFHKLIRVGLPNRLRGEIWEITSGSFWLRLQNPNLYTATLSKYSGRESLAIDEIEKDLNRSLPEYPGFQSEEGIGRLRRVLTAYSWVNEEVGYCQAMNIVVAALLIYMSESQAFSLLSVLCDRLLPGYYSQTMYGTLLDQRVFESLVEKTMPILWEHLLRSDVRLSVVSLPWFLSLYINSMPLVFAFRILDVFFLEGPKVLFQIGLGILRICGEDLLDVNDDGTFISILKTYFSRLDESAHPKSENEKLRSITKFQELMVVAFKEFSQITQATVSEQRAKYKNEVLDNIENFAKRTSIRNLGPESKRLSAEELGRLYDRFYEVLYEQERDLQMHRLESQKKSGLQTPNPLQSPVEIGRVGMGPSPETMNYDGFRILLASMAKWAVADTPRLPFDIASEKNGHLAATTPRYNEFPSSPIRGKRIEPADHDFMQRLYGYWNKDDKDGLSLQNVVTGIAGIKGAQDVMETIAYFFALYDDDHDGKVNREGILRMSEALLFLSRRGLEGNFTLIGSAPNGMDESINGSDEINISGTTLNEKFLSSVSAFIRRCFEYADPDNPHSEQQNDVTTDLGKFSIGDDEEDDLLDLGPGEDKDNQTLTKTPSKADSKPTTMPLSPQTPSKQSANLALDPANPLHITLPTFRMVILADELLQQFFEFSFAESLHIIPQAVGRASTFPLQTPTLTTFSGLHTPRLFAPPTPSFPTIQNNEQRSYGAPVKGIRGLLDGIVSDGIRVAAEVRKRIDEAQQDLDRSATGRDDGYEDEEEEDHDTRLQGFFAGVPGGGDAEKRSVNAHDRDLLDGAEVGSIKEHDQIAQLDLLSDDNATIYSATSTTRRFSSDTQYTTGQQSIFSTTMGSQPEDSKESISTWFSSDNDNKQ